MPQTTIVAIMLIVIVILYMLPTIIAYGRDHPHRQTLAVINIFLGWTVIGWFLVFLWAALAAPQTADIA